MCSRIKTLHLRSHAFLYFFSPQCLHHNPIKILHLGYTVNIPVFSSSFHCNKVANLATFPAPHTVHRQRLVSRNKTPPFHASHLARQIISSFKKFTSVLEEMTASQAASLTLSHNETYTESRVPLIFPFSEHYLGKPNLVVLTVILTVVLTY